MEGDAGDEVVEMEGHGDGVAIGSGRAGGWRR